MLGTVASVAALQHVSRYHLLNHHLAAVMILHDPEVGLAPAEVEHAERRLAGVWLHVNDALIRIVPVDHTLKHNELTMNVRPRQSVAQVQVLDVSRRQVRVVCGAGSDHRALRVRLAELIPHPT